MKAYSGDRFSQDRLGRKGQTLKRIVEVTEGKNLTEEIICSRTGLYQKSFQWIVKEGFASEDAAERIAERFKRK